MCDVTHSYVWHDSFICVTWLIRMCDATHSYICDTTHVTQTSCHTHERVTSHIKRSHGTGLNNHVTHMNESCHTYEWVMTYQNRQIDVLCHTYESSDTSGWVMSHVWMSHVTHMNESCDTYVNESCHTYEWVMSHENRRIDALCHTYESCHTYGWVMAHRWMSDVTHIWMSHGTHMNESLHTRTDE